MLENGCSGFISVSYSINYYKSVDYSDTITKMLQGHGNHANNNLVF